MKKTSFGIVVLLGIGLAVPAMAEAPEQKSPAAPAKAAPGSAKTGSGVKAGNADKASGAKPANPSKTEPGKSGAPGMGMGKDPHKAGFPGHGGMSPEQLREQVEKRRERMAERSKELREKAAKARASGDTKQAEQLDKAAERFDEKGARPHASGMMKPKAGPAWDKQKRARKVARLRPLWKKYGEKLKQQPVRAEFKKHAERVARLQRMREVASDNSNEDAREKLLQRIDVLLTKEKARHQVALQEVLGERKDKVVVNAEPGSGVKAPAASVNPNPQKPAAPAAPKEAK